MRIILRPIAANSNFLTGQPHRRLLQRRMLCRHTALNQGNNINGRVPDGRQTRLNPEILWIVDKQTFEIFLCLY